MFAARAFNTEATAKLDDHNRHTALSYFVAVTLGAAAFLSDLVPGTLGAILLTLTSSGFAWGTIALFVGFRQNTWRTAVFWSTVTLLIATAVYYALILGLSERWRGGATDFSGLPSVGRAVALWAVASLCAGPLLGTIGWKIRTGTERLSSILIAAYFGLCSADGFDGYFLQTSLQDHLNDSAVQFVQPGFLTIIFSALATSILLRQRRINAATITFVTSAALSVSLGILLWRLVSLARGLASV
ncbi:MAG TPA: DUF6518 family protein [Actinoplanes sp.]|nr:DUF6518 family protein [Actinoplanes sp.]